MFSCKMDGIPTIKDYDTAKRVFERIKPWRNYPDTQRPLRKRSEQHKTIVHDTWADTYAARLYNTDVVTYHKDGTIDAQTWGSRMTMEFFDAVAPFGMGATSVRGAMFIHVQTTTGWVNVQPERGTLSFRRVEKDSSVFEILNRDNVRPQYRKLVDRARAKEVREAIRPFLDWCRAIVALKGGNVPRVARDMKIEDEAWPYHHDLVTYLNDPGNLDTYRRAFMYIVHNRNKYTMPDVEQLVRDEAYMHMGAVNKHEMPFGEVPPRSKW